MLSDMNLVVLVGGILLVMFLVAAVLIVRGLRRGASGKGASAATSSAGYPASSPTAPKGDGVHIIERGRDGSFDIL